MELRRTRLEKPMSMSRQFIVLLVTAALTLTAVADVKRTSSGKPDLSGVYDTGILTPTLPSPGWPAFFQARRYSCICGFNSIRENTRDGFIMMGNPLAPIIGKDSA